MTTTTLTILSDSETVVRTAGLAVRITTDETTGRHYVSTGSRPRDHRTTREFASIADARRDAVARCQAAARAVEAVELFEVAL
jgi:hypothetical protein